MLRITLLQTTLHWEDAAANLHALEQQLSPLTTTTDIIVLPEMFTSGFTMNASSVAEAMDGPSMQWMRRTANRLGAVVTGSLVIESGGRYYNRLVWMQPDGNYRCYDKRHLFGLAGEEKTYTGGTHRLIFEWQGWKIFPLICYDLRFPVWSRRTADFDYDLLLYVANWPERRNIAWKNLLPARAIENQCYLAAVNRVGEDGNGIPHSGDSIVLDYFGQPLACADAGMSTILHATLDKTKLEEFRNQFPFSRDADPFRFN